MTYNEFGGTLKPTLHCMSESVSEAVKPSRYVTRQPGQVHGEYVAIFLFAAASAAVPDVCDDSIRYYCVIININNNNHHHHHCYQ